MIPGANFSICYLFSGVRTENEVVAVAAVVTVTMEAAVDMVRVVAAAVVMAGTKLSLLCRLQSAASSLDGVETRSSKSTSSPVPSARWIASHRATRPRNSSM